jgi:hypothetical protein
MLTDWLNEERLECGRAHTLFIGQREREREKERERERERETEIEKEIEKDREKKREKERERERVRERCRIWLLNLFPCNNFSYTN